MIAIRRLEKRFGRREVLRGVDLAPLPGRVTAIVGPNGAGKTTLIKAMVGLTRPDAGEIRVGGGDPACEPACRAHIGYMPQIARFPENLTASELIAMVQDIRGERGDVSALVRRFALESHLDHRFRTLSGGTRQKVNAVLALLFQPDVLILDEPTAGLDPVASRMLKDTVLEERTRGATVVVTTHVLSELEELADDVAFLLDGRIRFTGAIQELKRRTREFTLERAIAAIMDVEAA